MPSSWRASWLLPIAQAIAEGGWITVVYAAAAAVLRDVPAIGPFELALLAGGGMAWSRRRRWHGEWAGRIGLSAMVVLAGMIGWLLASDARTVLLAGEPLAAIRTHPEGWLAALAVVRGAGYADPADDEARADILLRWILPALAVPWLVGGLLAGVLVRPFTAAAFIGTVVFGVAAFVALGIARLETVRRSSGSDWRQNRSWLLLVVGVAAAMVIVAIPAGALLGVPLATIVSALIAPLRLVFVLLLLAATPLIVLAGVLSEQLRGVFPDGLDFTFLGDLLNRTIGGGPNDPPDLPALVFFAIVGILLVLELAFVGIVTWLRWQERRRMRGVMDDRFEEREIVLPDASAAPRRAGTRSRRAPHAGDDPVAVYLAALDALARDGRWTRGATETPLGHAARVAAGGPPIRRMATAYALVRYGARQPSPAELRRGRGRLAALQRALRPRR
ncbi:MAG: DUF4129 domain-containing protein [Chloroflexota bacterium]